MDLAAKMPSTYAQEVLAFLSPTVVFDRAELELGSAPWDRVLRVSRRIFFEEWAVWFYGDTGMLVSQISTSDPSSSYKLLMGSDVQMEPTAFIREVGPLQATYWALLVGSS